jgi:hypothetical protein
MRALAALAVLVACGGDHPATDANGDAPADTGPPLTCGYTEKADATNSNAAGAEATGLTLAGSTLLCGKLDSGHYDGGTQTVDVDAFAFTVSAASDLVARVYGSGAETLDTVALQITSMDGSMQLAFGVFVGDHAALIVHLPAGQYLAAVSAFSASALGAAVDYKVRFDPDTAGRCAKLTSGGYTETNDGAGSGNDMVNYDESASTPKTLTAATTDMPEPTGITVAAGTPAHIAGSSANVNPADSYMDRDTYLFSTGAGVNEMSIRLNWSATTVDFDYLVMPVPTTTVNDFAGGLATANSEDEFQTFAVKPSTMYWLWVGAYDGATGLPATYDATLCAGSFTP